MALGPGKYDDLAMLVRRKAMAQGACVVVLGGNRGSGFSFQSMGTATEQAGFAKAVAAIFREVADQIEADVAKALSSDPSTLPEGTVRADRDDD